ncbi:MAG: hypothetical protein ACRYGP_08620 [Janthinobacterium lividum]
MAEPFKPFTDDAAALTIGGMTIENGTDRISLSGSLDLARDRQGLDHAKALRSTLDGVIAALEAVKDLPARTVTTKPVPVTKKPNPFT